MKELTVCIQDEYEWKVIYRTELYTEEENKNLKSDVSVYKSQMNAYKKKYLALLKANTELVEENKKLKEEIRMLKEWATLYREDNKKLRETIKDHQLYEEKLEHRIIEFEELLHWE